MPVVALIVTSITLICAIITIIINFNLLYNVFVSKKLKKSPRLTLFYFRFLVDGCLGMTRMFQFVLDSPTIFLSDILIMFFMFLKLFGVEYIVTSHPYFVFSVIWPTANTVSIRTFLAVIINIDRSFAVFCPIFYRNHRISFNNYLLIFIASSYPILDNFVNWIVCKFELVLPPGCVTFGCIGNTCFLQYSLAYEVIAHSFIALSGLVLASKLFIFNNCKKGTKSKDLEKANQLALVDALIMIIFDVVPSFVLATVPVVNREVGSIMAFGKMTGLSLEAYIVYQTFMKKNETVPIANTKNFVVKSTNS